MITINFSNFKEETTITMVFGPFEMFVCAGMVHRLSLIKIAADAYDYAPYYSPKLRTFGMNVFLIHASIVINDKIVFQLPNYQNCHLRQLMITMRCLNLYRKSI